MEEVGHHLGVLDSGAGDNRFIAGVWLSNPFQLEACIN
jgi:hypothetical protein